jgi:pimeloyl-ACP methyl ester carboxylesterase
VGEFSKTRKVIAVEMQGHGRMADIKRDLSYENLSNDVAGLLDYLKIPSADIVGYSLGGGVAMLCAIRHPEKVRKVVSISARTRRDGWVKEANDFWPTFTWEAFKGTPMETEYKRLNPAPDKFPDFVNHLKATALRPYDFGADRFKAAKAPMFFIHGDADGVRLEHIAEMYRLKGGEVHGDMRARSESRLAILPIDEVARENTDRNSNKNLSYLRVAWSCLVYFVDRNHFFRQPVRTQLIEPACL